MSNLGVANEKNRYDIPLNKDAVASFQVQITALMVTLACWALAGFLSLDGLSQYWVSGLKNNITIELSPSKHPDGLFDADTLEARAQIIVDKVSKLEGIENIELLPRQDVANLVGSWVGENIQELPLPALISVELNTTSDDLLGDIRNLAQSIHQNTLINTHQEWLTDFLKTAYFFRYGSLLFFFVMGGALFMSVRGIIKARMSAYAKDIELLHLIGASDQYIASQFQRHATILALKSLKYSILATIIGLIFSFVFLASTTSLPETTGLSWVHLCVLMLVPLAAIGISAFTARTTTLQTLNELP